MNANVVADVVDHLHQHRVVFPGVDRWTREPPIDSHDGLRAAQSVGPFRNHLKFTKTANRTLSKSLANFWDINIDIGYNSVARKNTREKSST